jgi:hypothetical protein
LLQPLTKSGYGKQLLSLIERNAWRL